MEVLQAFQTFYQKVTSLTCKRKTFLKCDTFPNHIKIRHIFVWTNGKFQEMKLHFCLLLFARLCCSTRRFTVVSTFFLLVYSFVYTHLLYYIISLPRLSLTQNYYECLFCSFFNCFLFGIRQFALRTRRGYSKIPFVRILVIIEKMHSYLPNSQTRCSQYYLFDWRILSNF